MFSKDQDSDLPVNNKFTALRNSKQELISQMQARSNRSLVASPSALFIRGLNLSKYNK